MRKLLASLVVVLGLVASNAGCAFPPPYERADKVSLRLERAVPGGTVICGGWVVGHHAIATDEHCIEGGTDGWRVDGRKVRVRKVLKDGNDHVILLTDLYFARVAMLGPKPARGDQVFTLGNPDGQADILLLGHVAGFRKLHAVEGWGTFRDLILIDSNDWRGCSGAAVFDSQGRVVAMINSLWPWPNRGWKLSAAFSLKFTQAQYDEARKA